MNSQDPPKTPDGQVAQSLGPPASGERKPLAKRAGVWLFNRVPSWEGIRVLSVNRIVRSSYFWVAAIPLAAVALSPMPDRIRIVLGATELEFATDLPFRLVILYFTALTAFVGELVYSMRCPGFVKAYPSYNAFLERNGGNYKLASMLRYVLQQANRVRSQSSLSDIYMQHARRCVDMMLAVVSDPQDSHVKELKAFASGNQSDFPEGEVHRLMGRNAGPANAFECVKEFVVWDQLLWRMAAVALYFLSAIGAAWLICQATVNVIKKSPSLW